MEHFTTGLMTDISFDLETLNTKADAAVLSIGGCMFNRRTGEIGSTFYEEIEIDDAIKHGSVGGDTVAWWVRQGDDAKRLFTSSAEYPKLPLGAVLQRLRVFVDAAGPEANVWGNGATFDISILENAYERVGVEVPWKFWNIRDLRTLVDAAGALGFDKRNVEFAGTAHNAKDDAIHQAKIAIAAWGAIVPKVVAPAE